MTGQSLVLLPGLLCDAAVWTAQREALASVDGFVPSYGELSSITDMARFVLERAPAERFSLAGHSMGGRVALEVLRRAPSASSAWRCSTPAFTRWLRAPPARPSGQGAWPCWRRRAAKACARWAGTGRAAWCIPTGWTRHCSGRSST